MYVKMFVFHLIVLLGLCNCESEGNTKVSSEELETYGAFFNFGNQKSADKVAKIQKTNLPNAILKSKVEVLGGVFKRSIDALKAWGKLDMIFLIDASSSVGQENFVSELKFVKKLLSDVTVDYDHTRIAIVTYSSKGNVVSVKLLLRS